MRHSTKQRRRRQFHRLSIAENLEPRLALDAEGGIAFGNSPYLSLSFAADGTDVDGRSSQLFSYMNQIAAAPDWQQSIFDAFQTWSINTNADIAETPDGGQPFGAPGDTLGDSRFGDVRVGAIAMRANVYAVAVSRGFVSGTWSGDLLFNTRKHLTDVDEVFRVALHEAGHVFGLEHNQDLTSVMFESGISNVTQPSAADLDNLWSQFGQRSPDINELESNNDWRGVATDLHYSDGYAGETPLIAHADLGANDVDVYRFDTFDTGTGDVTFQVRTQLLSQLRPRIRVFLDGSNTPVLEASASPGQVLLSVTLIDAPDDQRYYVYVDKATMGLSAIGGYSLVTTFDDHLQTSPATIDLYAGPQFRFFDQRDIEDIFEGDINGLIPFLNDDLHTNDTLATATPLTTPPGYISGTKYQVIASLSDAVDIDFYQVRSADLTPSNVMSVLVEPVRGSNFPDIQITAYDHSGTIIPHTNLVRQSGRTLIQLQNVQPDSNHYLRIVSPTGDTGNYRLSVISGTQAEILETIVDDSIPDGAVTHTTNYAVPRPELTMFAFEGDPTNSPTQNVRVTIENLNGTPFAQFDAPAAAFVSVDSLILDPQTYRIRVEKLNEPDQLLNFKVLAAVVTESVGCASNH